ncbi:MAG: leucyl aminopeptidase family protein [Gammaproteobacteria bacterium]|nr:leucyl aminopeptidase family protein [Gammaproteobacteria bacterium]
MRIRASKPDAATLGRYGGALLLLPSEPLAADWQALPHATALRHLFESRPRKPGDHFTLHVGERAQTEIAVAIVGRHASPFDCLVVAGRAARALLEDEPRAVLLLAQGLGREFQSEALCAAVAALQAAAFALPRFKTRATPPRLQRIDLAAASAPQGLKRALASAEGNNLARWLTALPPNLLDAASYRRLLQGYARRHGLRYEFLDERRLRRLGAGAFLAVARGNASRDAGIVRLSYRPRGKTRPDLCLVGKGICFDTGGTNLKPHQSMLEMHTDMEGSAVALGCLHALRSLDSPLALDCWLAITENRIGPTAYQPQEVVRAHNGTTIQVIHTDAEGRMALADTLSLAAAERPRAIIDFATLTGACVRALTERYSGAFTNRPATRALIEAAGVASGERVWCFPMDADFDSDLESPVADVMQCAVDGKGDHILAARFLSRFLPAGMPWLHLDLAAGLRRGGLGHIGTDITGFGVRFTLELLARDWTREAARP